MSNPHISAFSAKKILLPVDFSASSQAALEAATGLAEQFHAGIHLVHIIPEIPDFNGSDFFPETSVLQERRETIQETLDAWKERLELQGIPTSCSIEEGNDVVGRLMEVIQRERTDMLVISTHGMSGWHPLIFGSIAEQVIKQANCTLLLLQSGRHGSAVEEPAIDAREDSFVPQVVGKVEAASTIPQSEAFAQRRLDRVALNMAERGERSEQHYDEAHSLFTK